MFAFGSVVPGSGNTTGDYKVIKLVDHKENRTIRGFYWVAILLLVAKPFVRSDE